MPPKKKGPETRLEKELRAQLADRENRLNQQEQRIKTFEGLLTNASNTIEAQKQAIQGLKQDLESAHRTSQAAELDHRRELGRAIDLREAAKVVAVTETQRADAANAALLAAGQQSRDSHEIVLKMMSKMLDMGIEMDKKTGA